MVPLPGCGRFFQQHSRCGSTGLSVGFPHEACRPGWWKNGECADPRDDRLRRNPRRRCRDLLQDRRICPQERRTSGGAFRILQCGGPARCHDRLPLRETLPGPRGGFRGRRGTLRKAPRLDRRRNPLQRSASGGPGGRPDHPGHAEHRRAASQGSDGDRARCLGHSGGSRPGPPDLLLRGSGAGGGRKGSRHRHRRQRERTRLRAADAGSPCAGRRRRGP